MAFKHRFTSPITDASDPDIVGPDEWNDAHQEDPSRSALVYEECFFRGTSGVYDGSIAQAVSGTGAATSDGSGEVTDPGLGAEGTGVHHPGMININTGTTTSGRCALAASQNLAAGNVILYAGGVRAGIVLRPGALSSGGQTYVARVAGLGDSVTGDSSNGVYFRYTDTVNSGNWEAVVQSSGEFAIDTGEAPTTTQFQKLEWVLNDAADEFEFFIDGVSVGTIDSGDISLPTAISISMIPASIIKTAGSTSRLISVDAYWYAFDIRSR